MATSCDAALSSAAPMPHPFFHPLPPFSFAALLHLGAPYSNLLPISIQGSFRLSNVRLYWRKHLPHRRTNEHPRTTSHHKWRMVFVGLCAAWSLLAIAAAAAALLRLGAPFSGPPLPSLPSPPTAASALHEDGQALLVCLSDQRCLRHHQRRTRR
ncbi:hypothetical protein B0H34DRAFT_196482 [Crassisporium funariophilum]|nr:hypothetical protein B0H34DRAFT_196482 [Crassisporium funariophilum]